MKAGLLFHRRSHVEWLLAASMLLAASPGWAITRYVDTNATPSSPYTSWATAATNIAQAYGACNSNDVILVTNGVHIVKLVQIQAAKPVTIRSVNGPGATFLDGKRSYLFLLYAGVVDGFTITNGYNGATAGGAVTLSGGAVRNCTFRKNISGGGRGGAIYFGGGTGSSVSNCIIADNVSSNAGGGIYVRTGTGNLITHSRLYNNSTPGAGGGIYVYSTTPVECHNLLIYSNRAPLSTGGGIHGNAYTVLRNCTITRNVSSGHGGGIYASAPAYNTIIYDNRTGTGTVWTNWSNSAGFTNCCIQWQPSSPILGLNNFTNNPKFVAVTDLNFRLSPGSPCINTGTNQAWMLGAVDLDRRGRLADFGGALVDRGAYEYWPAGTLVTVR